MEYEEIEDLELEKINLTSEQNEAVKCELTRMRNRHVARILTFLGDQPPFIQKAIKEELSAFKADVLKNLFDIDDPHYKWQS